MVNIPIDDGDTLHTVLFLCMACSDGNVVEDAKSHRRGWTGVMTRRPHRTEGILHVSDQHGIERFQHPAYGMQGYFAGFLGNAYVSTRQLGLTGGDKFKNLLDVARIVATGNLVEVCSPGGDNGDVLKRIERLPDRGKPFRALRVPVCCPVTHEIVVQKKSSAHHRRQHDLFLRFFKARTNAFLSREFSAQNRTSIALRPDLPQSCQALFRPTRSTPLAMPK